MGYYACASGTIVFKAENDQCKKDMIDTICKAFSCNYEKSIDENVFEVEVYDDGKFYDDLVREVLEAIAGSVVSGYISYSGEDDCFWRFCYNADSGQWDEEYADLVYPSDLNGASEELCKNAAEQYCAAHPDFIAQFIQNTEDPKILMCCLEKVEALIKKQYNI